MSLNFPLKGETNRPIYDAAGRLVSIPLNAPMFVAAANLAYDLAQCGEGAIPAIWRDRARKAIAPE